MLLKEKWEALYDFSQDREEYERLCAEMCYNAENNIECAKRLNKLSKKLEFKDTIDNSLLDLKLLEELKDDDKELEKEYFELYTKLEKQIDDFETELLLSGKYDNNNAILTLHAGEGGTEAQDWTEMLYRMYYRWAATKGFKVEVLDCLDGDVAGIKSISFIIKGENAYGLLKSEHGVHRLVRVSPFDAKGRRHTSFAAVEVIPELSDDTQIVIRPEDCEYQTFRSGGPGGQYQNTTESGIRIIHKPTGLIAESRQERSQAQNKETCLKVLRGKLAELELEKQQEEINKIKGIQMANGWGSQIRSYVFMPYQLVKDERTGYESAKINDVMDGDIDGFIHAYLKNSLVVN